MRQRTLTLYDRAVWLSKTCNAKLYLFSQSRFNFKDGTVSIHVNAYGENFHMMSILIKNILASTAHRISKYSYAVNSDSRLLVIPSMVIETRENFDILIAKVKITERIRSTTISKFAIWINEKVRTEPKYEKLRRIIKRMVNVNIFGATFPGGGLQSESKNFLITYKPADIMNTFMENADLKFKSVGLYYQYPKDIFKSIYFHEPFDYEKYNIGNHHRDTEVPSSDTAEQTSEETIHTPTAAKLFGTSSAPTATIG